MSFLSRCLIFKILTALFGSFYPSFSDLIIISHCFSFVKSFFNFFQNLFCTLSKFVSVRQLVYNTTLILICQPLFSKIRKKISTDLLSAEICPNFSYGESKTQKYLEKLVSFIWKYQSPMEKVKPEYGEGETLASQSINLLWRK